MKAFDDSGVSESLGYILVFAIVLTGIAGIVFFGVTLLNDAKDRNNFQNVEQGLTVVQSDLKRVAMEKAPVKTTKLHVEGGTLSTDFLSSWIRVDFGVNIYNNTIGNITYYSNTGLKKLSIENGGLWESSGYTGGDMGIAPPRIYSSSENDAIVINVIRLDGTNSAFSGAGTTSMIMEYLGNRVINFTSEVPADVTITVNTAYPGAWSRFLNDTISGFTVTPVSITDSQTKMTISGVSQVIVSEHTVHIRPFVLTS